MFKDFRICSVPFWCHVSGISLLPASLPQKGLSKRLFFSMHTEEPLVFSEMGTYFEPLWGVRVVIPSVAGTSLNGDQQCMSNANHFLCLDLPNHSFPGSLYTNPQGS